MAGSSECLMEEQNGSSQPCFMLLLLLQVPIRVNRAMCVKSMCEAFDTCILNLQVMGMGDMAS